MLKDSVPIFAVTPADVKAALIEEQVALSSGEFEDACLYVRLMFEVLAVDTIADGVQDFLYEKRL